MSYLNQEWNFINEEDRNVVINTETDSEEKESNEEDELLNPNQLLMRPVKPPQIAMETAPK
jgi:hypothetical protein